MSLRTLIPWLCAAMIGIVAAPAVAQDPPPNPRVLVETTAGNFEIELFRDRVPATVVNFLLYVRDGYYNGTVFHRVIRDVIIQGGAFVVDDENQLSMKVDGLRGQIINQASRSLQNRRGTVAMARGEAPDSARQQFFINLENNTNFDYRNGTPSGIGYAVFGEVTDGMNVVRDINRGRTGTRGNLLDFPNEPVVITSITRVETTN